MHMPVMGRVKRPPEQPDPRAIGRMGQNISRQNGQLGSSGDDSFSGTYPAGTGSARGNGKTKGNGTASPA
jgi:hypothetical protein